MVLANVSGPDRSETSSTVLLRRARPGAGWPPAQVYESRRGYSALNVSPHPIPSPGFARSRNGARLRHPHAKLCYSLEGITAFGQMAGERALGNFTSLLEKI